MAKWLVWLRGFAVANLICPCCLHVTAVLTLRDRRAVISVGMGGTQQQRGTRSWYYLNGLLELWKISWESVQGPSSGTEAALSAVLCA